MQIVYSRRANNSTLEELLKTSKRHNTENGHVGLEDSGVREIAAGACGPELRPQTSVKGNPRGRGKDRQEGHSDY